MKPVLKQYAQWVVDNEGTDDEMGYWQLYDTLEQVQEQTGEIEDIYECDFKNIGKWKKTVELVRLKEKKIRK
jgi:hypothetical protein